jgi:hypothetical protein
MTKIRRTDPAVAAAIIDASQRGLNVYKMAKGFGISAQRAWSIVRRSRHESGIERTVPRRAQPPASGRAEPTDATLAEAAFAYGGNPTRDQACMGTPPRGRSALDRKEREGS